MKKIIYFLSLATITSGLLAQTKPATTTQTSPQTTTPASTNAPTQTTPPAPTKAPGEMKEHKGHKEHMKDQSNALGTSKTNNPAAYACPKCFEISKGESMCSKCSVAKVQLGNYYCNKCAVSTGAMAGKCPTCKSNTVRITRKYCAAHGQKSSDAMGKEKAQ